jgi:hypothetical protein
VLADAETALGLAQDAEAEAREAVQAASDALDDARNALLAAQADEAAAQVAYDSYACSNGRAPQHVQCRADKAAALVSWDGAKAATLDAESELTAAETAHSEAVLSLEEATAAVGVADEAVQAATEHFAAATIALTEAEAARDLAKDAVDSYVPPTTEIIADKHPGCHGIQNAQAQVVKAGNDKGKGALALTAVAAKLGC